MSSGWQERLMWKGGGGRRRDGRGRKGRGTVRELVVGKEGGGGW